MNHFNARETTARAEGNTSGISYVQTNASSFGFYTEAEKNASDSSGYSSGKSLGVMEGNASGIEYVKSNPGLYSLFSEDEKNASVESATKSGKAESLATVQAEMAVKGLSVLSYVNQISVSKPYTEDWFYQPNMGWLWTDESVYPYFYLVKNGEQAGGWLYFGQLTGQTTTTFYDYLNELWITPYFQTE